MMTTTISGADYPRQASQAFQGNNARSQSGLQLVELSPDLVWVAVIIANYNSLNGAPGAAKMLLNDAQPYSKTPLMMTS